MGNEKIYKQIPLKNTLLVICLFSSLMFLSCVNTASSKYESASRFTDNWAKEYSKIQNINDYIPKINEMIKYFDFKATDKQMLNLKSSMLMIAYSRLYVIESEKGSQAQAEVYFNKAKKWYYLKNKYSGTQTPEQTKEIMNSFTHQAIKQMILKLDPKLVNSFKNDG